MFTRAQKAKRPMLNASRSPSSCEWLESQNWCAYYLNLSCRHMCGRTAYFIGRWRKHSSRQRLLQQHVYTSCRYKTKTTSIEKKICIVGQELRWNVESVRKQVTVNSNNMSHKTCTTSSWQKVLRWSISWKNCHFSYPFHRLVVCVDVEVAATRQFWVLTTNTAGEESDWIQFCEMMWWEFWNSIKSSGPFTRS
jgi:hypothetical protein